MASIFNWLLNSGTVPLFSSICHLLPACCFCVFLNVAIPISCKWKLVTGKICPWHIRPICLHQREESSTASARGFLLFLCSRSSMVWISGCADHNKDGLCILILAVVLHSDTQKLLASETTFTRSASVLLKLLNGICLRTKNVYFSSEICEFQEDMQY